jgi:plastocyanin
VRPWIVIAATLLGCAPPPERTIDVGMLEYAFLPQRIEVRTGERVRFAVKNTGKLEHDFSGDQRGKALGLGHVHLGPGGTGATDWTALATPGEVKVVCTIRVMRGSG